MSTDATAPAAQSASIVAQQKAPIGFGDTGVKIASIEDAYRFATCVIKSGLAPKGFDTPEAVVIALQHAAELGLAPMQGMQSIGVINGRPGIYGDAALALVRRSGLLETYAQGIEGEADLRRAFVTVKRVGDAANTTHFSVADAKKAGLWGKAGPWTQYPDRMLLFRARGFSLRDCFGDVLKGLRTVEELRDTPAEKNVTPIAEKLAGGLAGAIEETT
jgi:hypothetical protein